MHSVAGVSDAHQLAAYLSGDTQHTAWLADTPRTLATCMPRARHGWLMVGKQDTHGRFCGVVAHTSLDRLVQIAKSTDMDGQYRRFQWHAHGIGMLEVAMAPEWVAFFSANAVEKIPRPANSTMATECLRDVGPLRLVTYAAVASSVYGGQSVSAQTLLDTLSQALDVSLSLLAGRGSAATEAVMCLLAPVFLRSNYVKDSAKYDLPSPLMKRWGAGPGARLIGDCEDTAIYICRLLVCFHQLAAMLASAAGCMSVSEAFQAPKSRSLIEKHIASLTRTKHASELAHVLQLLWEYHPLHLIVTDGDAGLHAMVLLATTPAVQVLFGADRCVEAVSPIRRTIGSPVIDCGKHVTEMPMLLALDGTGFASVESTSLWDEEVTAVAKVVAAWFAVSKGQTEECMFDKWNVQTNPWFAKCRVIAVFGANVSGAPAESVHLADFTSDRASVLDSFDTYQSTPYTLPPCIIGPVEHLVLPRTDRPLLLLPGRRSVPANSGLAACPFGVNTLCVLETDHIELPAAHASGLGPAAHRHNAAHARVRRRMGATPAS